MVNARFGTAYHAGSIASLKCYLGVRSGIVTTFRKGHHASPGTEFKKGRTPLNKGTRGMWPTCGGHTKFKPGHVPVNRMPVGSEIINTEGYWKVKIADPNVWAFKHRLLWEEAHGPVPEDMVVTFLDGNKMHCTLDNLAVVTKSVHCRLNKCGLRGDTPELGRVAVLTAEILTAIQERKRK